MALSARMGEPPLAQIAGERLGVWMLVFGSPDIASSTFAMSPCA